MLKPKNKILRWLIQHVSDCDGMCNHCYIYEYCEAKQNINIEASYIRNKTLSL